MDQDHQEKTMSRFSNFWDWFVERNEYIYQNLETDTGSIALEITEHLKKIHQDIEFEIPFDFNDNMRSLIISADGDVELFDTVEDFVKSAPPIPKWNIIAFRPRLHQKNQVIDLEGITMDYNDIFFTYEEDHYQLIVNVYVKNFDGADNRYVHLYFLLLDSLIGEYDSVNLIKETRIYPYKKDLELLEFPLLLGIIDELKATRGEGNDTEGI